MVSRMVNNPYVVSTFFFAFAAIMLPVPAAVLGYAVETRYISWTKSLPKDAVPWREGLDLNVYWSEKPSEAARSGVRETAGIFGVGYAETDTRDEANLIIHLNTWHGSLCKYGIATAFEIPDKPPTRNGIEKGNIYLCSWTLPWHGVDGVSERSIMAHETAHILSGANHFGTGLMAADNNDRTQWFIEEDISYMLDHVERFRDRIDG